jgi:hypothetical protein
MKYHVNTYGDDTEGFTKGLLKAIQLTTSSNSKQLLMRIGALANTEGIMSNVLGEKFVKSLIKEKEKVTKIGDCAITIFLEGDNTRRSNFLEGTAFCPWLIPNSLVDILNDRRVCESVFVPWMPEERDSYIQNNPDSIEVFVTRTLD